MSPRCPLQPDAVQPRAALKVGSQRGADGYRAVGGVGDYVITRSRSRRPREVQLAIARRDRQAGRRGGVVLRLHLRRRPRHRHRVGLRGATCPGR